MDWRKILGQRGKETCFETFRDTPYVHAFYRAVTHLRDHEDEDGHSRRLGGLLYAVVLPVVVVVVRPEGRR